MEYNITRAMDFKHEPVAVVLADREPEKTKQFKPGKWDNSLRKVWSMPVNPVIQPTQKPMKFIKE
jgi:hypothetical protein